MSFLKRWYENATKWLCESPARMGFISGWTISTALICLYQDWLGQERFIETIKADWVTPWIGVPVSLFGLVLGYVAYKLARWVEQEIREEAANGKE